MRVTEARSATVNAQSIDDKIKADNLLTSALQGLKVTLEAYPELKANQNFLQLQTEISDIENKLAAASSLLPAVSSTVLLVNSTMGSRPSRAILLPECSDSTKRPCMK